MDRRTKELIIRNRSILRGIVNKDWIEIEQKGTSFTFTITVMEPVLAGGGKLSNPKAVAWALKVYFPRFFPADEELFVHCIGDSADRWLLHYVVNTQLKMEVIYEDNEEEMEKLFKLFNF